VAYRKGWYEGIQRFCTEENGYQQGCQGAPFANLCPNEQASQYLDGYQSGYAVYLLQLEVDAMERAIDDKSDSLEQIWNQLDLVSRNLERRDADAPQRAGWLEQAHALTRRQDALRIEIDEMESELSARKAQLTQMRRAIAINN